jgi:ribonuclease E
MPIPAAEVPEKFTPAQPREIRTPVVRVPEIREPREIFDGFGEAFDTDSEVSHLVNHPSYQELGDHKRRTRTRRSRIGGANLKEESRPEVSGFGGEMDSDLETDTELTSLVDIPSLLSESLLVKESPKTPTFGRVGWTERPERTKVKIEPIKPVIEPPQIVQVEMTDQEQDMFALMGISPGVKLETEAKSPKSVIYNIMQPGEIISDTGEFDMDSMLEEKPKLEFPKVKLPTSKVPLAIEPPTEQSGNIGFEALSEDESNLYSPTRRRRRRPSAQE